MSQKSILVSIQNCQQPEQKPQPYGIIERMKLPETLRPYFWNCRFEELDKIKHHYAIISTLLEHGDVDALRWMLRAYKKKDIVDTLRRTRILSPINRNFWALHFHITLPEDDARKYSAWHNRGRYQEDR